MAEKTELGYRSLSVTTSKPDDEKKDDAPVIVNHTDDLIRTAYHKIDLRLLAWYCFSHLLLSLNAHNITNAAIINREDGSGIEEQLGLSSDNWAWILSSFYYPFIVFETFASLGLKSMGPRQWMSRIMLTWGIISICQAAVQNYGGLLACRILLGVAESGFYASIIYHLSFWYPADKLPLRLATLAASSYISGIPGGLIAFGTSYMDGMAGLSGWQWLFIIEGIPPILCALYTVFFLPNYPENSTLLTEAEKNAVLAILPESQPSSQDKTWDPKAIKALLKDPTTYLFALIWALHGTGAKGIMFVLPTVLWRLNLSGTAIAQLMSMPPYLFGASGLILIAWLIQKDRIRAWSTALALTAFCCACFVVLIFVKNSVAKLVIISVATTSSIGVFPILWTERIKAIRGSSSAAIAIGTTSAAAHVVGIVGGHSYNEKFGPHYQVSFSISTALLGFNMIVILLTWIIISRRPKQAGFEVQ